MVRSSGTPRGRALGAISAIISGRSSSKTVKRPSESKDSLDQTVTTTTEYSESMWLFAPNENTVQSLAGERVTGDLGALVTADGTVDLQRDDRLTHGGVEYEIDSIVGRPNDESPNYWMVTLVRRQ